MQNTLLTDDWSSILSINTGVDLIKKIIRNIFSDLGNLRLTASVVSQLLALREICNTRAVEFWFYIQAVFSDGKEKAPLFTNLSIEVAQKQLDISSRYRA